MVGTYTISVSSRSWIRLPQMACLASVFAQMVSGLGLTLEVDWTSLFKSFYERVRVKVAFISPGKIPAKRLYEMDKNLYLIGITVEGLDPVNRGISGDEGGDDNVGNDDFNADDYDDVEDSQNMETDKGTEKTPPNTQLNVMDRWMWSK
jgi:hypothetical protein